VPPGSLDYWRDRITARGVDVAGPERRFEDPDGTRVELVTGESPLDPWGSGPVPVESAIRGIHGVAVLPADPYATASTLESLGGSPVLPDWAEEDRGMIESQPPAIDPPRSGGSNT